MTGTDVSEADVLTAYGFRLLARAESARYPYRRGLLAAALVAFTDAAHSRPVPSPNPHDDQKGTRP